MPKEAYNRHEILDRTPDCKSNNVTGSLSASPEGGERAGGEVAGRGGYP